MLHDDPEIFFNTFFSFDRLIINLVPSDTVTDGADCQIFNSSAFFKVNNYQNVQMYNCPIFSRKLFWILLFFSATEGGQRVGGCCSDQLLPIICRVQKESTSEHFWIQPVTTGNNWSNKWLDSLLVPRPQLHAGFTWCKQVALGTNLITSRNLRKTTQCYEVSTVILPFHNLECFGNKDMRNMRLLSHPGDKPRN